MLTLEQQNHAYNAYLETMNYLTKPKSLLHLEFSHNSAMYVFTTENLVDYINKLKPENKSILTVTGSGDQLINLSLLGAKKIDNFDINQNAYFITQLKLSALQTLSYEEFLNFFCLYENQELKNTGLIAYQKSIGENNLAFDFKTYLKIKPYLDDTSAFFWNLIYEEFQFDGKSLASSKLFFEGIKSTAIKNNEYLQSKEKYSQACELIKDVEIKFMECNLLDVHTLQSTYDIMLFSNVYDYLTDDWYSIISADNFVKYVEEQASQRLNNGGRIVVAYQYNYKIRSYTNMRLINELLNKKYVLDRMLPLETVKSIVIISSVITYSKEGTEDCIYLYEKKN